MQECAIDKNMEKLKAIADLIKIISDNTVSITVTDLEKVIYVNDCDELKSPLQVGDDITSNKFAQKVIKEKKKLIGELTSDKLGTFKGYTFPIIEDNEVVGVMMVARSLSRKKKVTGVAKELSESLKEISSAINNISSGVQDLASMSDELLIEGEKSRKAAENTKGVVEFIQAISKQTNLLGLNAAIEAARAGDSGRGFSIVAQEIRKLSNSSSESINEIDNVIKNISESIKTISEKIDKSNAVCQNQSAAVEEITASISELYKTSETLASLAENL